MSDTFGIEVERKVVLNMIEEVEENITTRQRWLARKDMP
jgi:hypothetical protein